MAQEGAQGRGRGDVNLGELGSRHLGPGALAEVDGAQGQGQSPQAAALGQLPYRETRDLMLWQTFFSGQDIFQQTKQESHRNNMIVPLTLADDVSTKVCLHFGGTDL